MDPELILWRSPLVYKDVEPSPNSDCEFNQAEGILTSEHFTIQIQGLPIKIIPLSDVLGADVSPAQAWTLHTYPIRQGDYIYQPLSFSCENAIACEKWVYAIRSALGQEQPRSLTVLINPESGRGQGQKIWTQVQPIFQQARCTLQVYETQSAKDLRQQVQAIELGTCAGLVLLGGDGSVFHGVNGLMQHPDRDQAMRLPLGFIPTGTSNGLVKSILDADGLNYSAHNMAVAIAKGHIGALDLLQITQQTQTYFSILSLSWGFFSDVDIESDRLKSLGFLKNYLFTLLRLMTYRSYPGIIELKTPTGWEIIDTPVVTLWMMNVAWAAYNFKPTPKAQLNDRFFDIWITHNTVSRWQFLQTLLKAFDGKHLAMKGIDYYKAQALKITPSCQGGIFAVDGEQVAYQPIEISLFPQTLAIFRPRSASPQKGLIQPYR